MPSGLCRGGEWRHICSDGGAVSASRKNALMPSANAQWLCHGDRRADVFTGEISRTLYNGGAMENRVIERAGTVANEFRLDGKAVDLEPLGKGHINDTFLVTTEGGGVYVLQRVNPIFAATVLEDIDVLTREMKRAGFTTTELVPTRTGELGSVISGELWRVLTYIRGQTLEEGITENRARNAMGFLAKFHHTFADHDYIFRHVREGFHDTPRIMATLEETTRMYTGTKKSAALADLSGDILAAYGKTPHAWAHLPKRIIHGDPKLNNIRFAEHSDEAVALLDLDTLGRHSVVVDIADAARSWCNRADEGDERGASFDLGTFRAMAEGYAEHADFLTAEERRSIPGAILQIALELGARFATDAYRESYFKLDRTRYPDLFTQNFAKARAQFALYRDVKKKLPDIAAQAENIDKT